MFRFATALVVLLLLFSCQGFAQIGLVEKSTNATVAPATANKYPMVAITLPISRYLVGKFGVGSLVQFNDYWSLDLVVAYTKNFKFLNDWIFTPGLENGFMFSINPRYLVAEIYTHPRYDYYWGFGLYAEQAFGEVSAENWNKKSIQSYGAGVYVQIFFNPNFYMESNIVIGPGFTSESTEYGTYKNVGLFFQYHFNLGYFF